MDDNYIWRDTCQCNFVQLYYAVGMLRNPHVPQNFNSEICANEAIRYVETFC